MVSLRVIHLLCASLALAMITCLGAFLPEPQLTTATPGKGWFTLIHLYTNEYHTWRFDHVVRAIPVITISGLPVFGPFGGQLTILLLGTLLLLHRLEGSFATRPLLLWACAILTTLSVPLVVGKDIVVLGTVCWLPVLLFFIAGMLAVCRTGLAKGAAPLFILFLFVACQASESSSQLAPLIAIGALVMASRLADTTVDGAEVESRTWIIPVLILALPAILAAASAPSPLLPDYPPLAHVVPDDGLEGIPTNLIGADYPIAIIDRLYVKVVFGTAAVLLAGAALVISLCIVSALSYSTRTVLLSGTALLFVAALDLLPDQISSIMPVATGSRLVPWGPGFSLLPVALGTGALFVTCATTVSRIPFAPIFWFITVLCASLTTGLLVPKEGVDSAFVDAARTQWRTSDERTQQILASPSLAVIRHFYPELPLFNPLVFNKALLGDDRLRPLPPGTKVTALPEDVSRNLDRLWDGKPKSRWSTKSGRQNGGETLQFEFPKALPIMGIDLSTGAFPSDFPRGLTVRGGPSCSQTDLKTIALYPSWQGALRFTPQGYPYFSGQEAVRVLITEPAIIKCLVIVQTSSARYDWSVAEVTLLTAQSAP